MNIDFHPLIFIARATFLKATSYLIKKNSMNFQSLLQQMKKLPRKNYKNLISWFQNILKTSQKGLMKY